MEPVHLGKQHYHLNVAPEEIEPALSQAFYILVSNFPSKRAKLPKDMVMAQCTEPPLFMVYIPQPRKERQPSTAKPLSSGGPLTALLHYKLAKDWEAQMNRQKAGSPKTSNV